MTAEERFRELLRRVTNREADLASAEFELRLATSRHQQAADNLAKAKDSLIEAAKEMTDGK